MNSYVYICEVLSPEVIERKLGEVGLRPPSGKRDLRLFMT